MSAETNTIPTDCKLAEIPNGTQTADHTGTIEVNSLGNVGKDASDHCVQDNLIQTSTDTGIRMACKLCKKRFRKTPPGGTSIGELVK